MLFLNGCVHYGQFRNDRPGHPESQSIWRPVEEDLNKKDPNKKDCNQNASNKKDCRRSNYYLAFVEVDEFGEMFDHRQLDHAMALIHEAKRDSQTKALTLDGRTVSTHNAIVVTFIHGWKNNASDNSGNVWGFRDALADLADNMEEAQKKRGALDGEKPEPVVGIYIGWRGSVTNLGVVKEFTFFDRRNAAARIPGAHLTEILREIIYETKACIKPQDSTGNTEQCPKDSTEGPGTKSLAVIVGHSFGGLVLEHTLTQAVTAVLLDREAVRKDRQERDEKAEKGNFIKPVADLIVMVNEAAPATESKQLLDLLKRHGMQLCVDIDPKTMHCNENQPLFLSITSVGDWATGLTLPIGQGASSLFRKNFRTYPDQDPNREPIPHQRTYYLHSTAHLPPLFSHVLGPAEDPSIQRATAAAEDNGRSRDVHCFIIEHLNERRYCVVPVIGAYNTTPYWVMQMGKEFVPDHSQIFRPAFRELLGQFLALKLQLTQPGTPIKPVIQ